MPDASRGAWELSLDFLHASTQSRSSLPFVGSFLTEQPLANFCDRNDSLAAQPDCPRTRLEKPEATMPLSRREFAKGLAAATAVLPLNAAAQVVADEPQKTPEPSMPDPLRMEAALWLELIRTRYPDPRLTPEVLTLVAGDVLGDIMHCRRISSFPLKNSDAPAFA